MEDEVRAMTKVVATDDRIIVVGHSWNAAACVAVSAVVQTAARIAALMDLLAEPVSMIDGHSPIYTIVLKPTELGRACIAGAVAALHGVATKAPGSLLFSDVRKIDVPVPPPPNAPNELHPEAEVSGGYAESRSVFVKPIGSPIIVARDVEGKPQTLVS